MTSPAVPEKNARWSVYRQDDIGNVFLVEAGMSEREAAALVAELESHGHKQLYWTSREQTAAS